MSKISRCIIQVIVLCSVLILFTCVISHFELDLSIAQTFYKNNSWHLSKKQPWNFIYHYGTYPALIIGLCSILTLFGSFSIDKLTRYRKEALYILLVLIIGPGLLVNSTFKDHWGRPRPREVKEFGGKWEFREVWEPGVPGKGKSFPCGHCSMGFFLITIYFAYRNKNKFVKYGAIPLALLHGGLMSFARMMQGGHFLSDTIWSAGLVFLSSILSYYALYELPRPNDMHVWKRLNTVSRKWKIVWTVLLTTTGCAIILWALLLSKPLYKEFQHVIELDSAIKVVNLNINNQAGDIEIYIDDIDESSRINSSLNGFGYLNKNIRSNFDKKIEHDTLYATFSLHTEGYFNELTGKTVVLLDDDYLAMIYARTEEGDIIFHPSTHDSIILSIELEAPHGEIYRYDHINRNVSSPGSQ